ncbi:hypothetical protein EV361DRAFT_973160 [Lentinula raphanica]|uniref:peptidylprolyl isomerase n=1 Tax=Lentinula raphanica TaxID=153919 RepID=A0AA38UDZ8_9AGAR|nr:hypothetical protein C8R42DRAFT_393727 [Lentinula raphanica]KAJ3770653.1 hypothetical protein FB446DRAFT_146335 [Lentinula raphanica]KAJ3818964.1 hypothetical protein F5880DRAFT_1625809 [Lentinula raphanica]KAJ3837931.1 hypothetical protein F5878DRAFT_620918 [Lentinula raphanica]KAJ3967475.1 hypothetical protein EV361DRAFT_973160 [Lentinula raphanica]
MQIINWALLVFAAVATTYAQDSSAAQPPEELVIENIYMPDACTIKAENGDSIKVHYTGTLFANGNKFDSSYDRNAPLPLKLGVGQVIKGWDEGLQGMCVGEKRRLIIPSHKAYGSRGFANLIPANSALVFETELVEVTGKSHDEL